ncbi:MAG TPA: 4Fe-4S binding protein [Candidatus Omnitrophota bacterium]|jgi:NADH-quinone oxidoreductase subunit I|nr:MAG: NADH-quinone oxidoreductase subunit I [Candidatus Omnitrophica bacterium ADurb.Bin314]HOE68171.1 4Fe-4S binding protein [Candidatus Omnitrophota bacterium]HQB93970.1 4Fe-4S binding protein [Candidatus Omnitrophota bacterium]
MTRPQIAKEKNPVFGTGILQGMWVTMKNFIDSYFKKADQGGIFTIQYPEELCRISENSRNFPFLVYDAAPDSPRCTACGICERECPTKCIHVEMAKDTAGKPLRKPAVFEIDYGLCMNCGMCEDVCPFDSIFMDRVYEIAGRDRTKDMLIGKDALLKPNAYFQKIRPKDAADIDARRKAAEAKKAAAARPATPPDAGGTAS